MPLAPPTSTVRLRPGLRASRRGDRQLQVGLHPGQRVVLPDTAPVRQLLQALDHGIDPSACDPALRPLLAELSDRGLVGPADERLVRKRLLEAARVAVVAPEQVRAAAVRALLTAGLQVTGEGASPVVELHVTTGAEPRRERLDEPMRADRPHLALTVLAGHTRLGPLVVPGLTACVRCIDEHLTDRDPRHPLVLEQHHDRDPTDEPPAADLQLALAWAARDVAAWVDGHRPATWSATVDIGAEGPVIRSWNRHPRCGCAWGDLLAG